MKKLLVGAAVAALSVLPSSASAAVIIATVAAWGETGLVTASFALPPVPNQIGGGNLGIGVGLDSLSINASLVNSHGAIFQFDRELDLTKSGIYEVVGGSFAFMKAAPGIPGFIQYASALTGGKLTLTYSDSLPTGFYNASFNAVPEPATWGMMIAGFGVIGAGLRRRKLAYAN